MRKILVLILVCVSAFCFSQSKKKNALYTIRGNIGISRPISSSAFRNCFAGVYEGNLSLNLRVVDKFYLGIGYQSNLFQNSKFLKEKFYINSKQTSVSYNTSLVGNSGFIKLGYDKFFSDKGYISYSINTGLMFAHYADVNADTTSYNQPYGALKFSAPYVQPEISFNFIAETRLSFSIMLSYTTLFYDFDPKAPRFNHFTEINTKSNNYFMSWFNIGFGFNVLLGK